MSDVFFKIGDDDPYPLELPIESEGKKAGTWELWEGRYRAFQIGPIVEVSATFYMPYLNSEARLFTSPIAVFPPEFSLYLFRPEIVLPAQPPESEFSTKASFISASRIASINIWDRNGRQTIPVTQSPA